MRVLLLLIITTAVAVCFHYARSRRSQPGILAKAPRLEAVPVVLWHGMGDCCCNPFSMGMITAMIEENIEGVYVKSLMFGGNVLSDTVLGFIANVNDLVTDACRQIRDDPRLQTGYNAIGFSQGGQFLRAVAQRCPDPPMRNLISVGGQHQGVFGLPPCSADSWLCNGIRQILDMIAYEDYIQKWMVQAQYWHDPWNVDKYKHRSLFLAEINNELDISEDYKNNLLNLKNFLLIMFTQDSMVIPKESSWFGFYEDGNLDVILAMNETKLYKEDRIGLRRLHETGRLHFLAVEGGHLQIGTQTFITEVIDKFLK